MYRRLFLVLILMVMAGCAAPRISLFGNGTDPLEEYVIQGEGKEKILLISVAGEISDKPDSGLLRTYPGTVETVAAQLRKAENDGNIRAVILKIDSPGGTVTAGDILYHELLKYKNKTGVKLVSIMMGLAASGGYYIALPSDCIVAHPTTITGSVGTILIQPHVSGLMKKLGLAVSIDKSGKYKDMGSPFRDRVPDESDMLKKMIAGFGDRFSSLVNQHRKITPKNLEKIKTARLFVASEALELGMIDEIGYFEDAVAAAKKAAKLPDDPKIIVYRRSELPDATPYHIHSSNGVPLRFSPLNPGVSEAAFGRKAGFYYLWLPGDAIK